MKDCDEEQVDEFNKNSAVSAVMTAEVEITHMKLETEEVVLFFSPSALLPSRQASLDRS